VLSITNTAKWGGAAVSETLLEAGARVAQATTLGVQPLHMAAQEGQEETARLLLRHGAPAGATDRAGWSAFHYAANHRWATWRGGVEGQLAILEMLVEHGANVDASDGEGYTCVHSAAQSGKVEMLRLLRRLGARPDAVTVRGVAPVHVAAEGGRAAVVAELLDWCPAAAECEDVRGHRPLHHAAYHGHADVVETLLARGADACPNGDETHSRKRAAGGADADALETRRRGPSRCATPLHLAARSGSLACVVVLLAGGADPTRVDARGWTPRRLAAECAAREAKTRGSGATNEPNEPNEPNEGDANGTGAGAGRSASERNRASRTNRAAVDAVLERAEAGTPLLWSRATHRLFPERFRRDARDVLRASWGATRLLRGLAADLVHDEVLRAGARNVWPKDVTDETWRAVERVRAAVEARWRDVEARDGRLARGVGLGMGLEFGGSRPFHAGGRYGPTGAFEPFDAQFASASDAAETATSPGEGERGDSGERGEVPAARRATSAQCAARREMLNAPAPGTPPGSAGPGCADGSVAEDDAMETGDGDGEGSEDEDEVQSAPPTARQTAAAEFEAERRHEEARAAAQQHAAMQRELFAMYETQMHLAAALAAQ